MSVTNLPEARETFRDEPTVALPKNLPPLRPEPTCDSRAYGEWLRALEEAGFPTGASGSGSDGGVDP